MTDGRTRRMLFAGAATAGGAVTAAGCGLLASAPETVAAPGQPPRHGHVYVSASGRDSNSGMAWDSAVRSIKRALERTAHGTIHVGSGTFGGGFTIGRQAVRGAGRDATIIRPASSSQPVVTMTDGALLSDVNVQGNQHFRGTGILITGTLVHVQDVDVKNDEHTDPRKGEGGTGVVLRDGEGCLLTRVTTTRQRLAWKIGGANHVFVDMRGDSNYQDVLIGAENSNDGDTFKQSGAHLILGSKFVQGGNTGVRGAGTVRCIEIAGAGEHTLIDCDWEEADLADWLVASDNNVLTRCAVAPHTTLTLGGSFNTVQNLKILGRTLVTGSDNTLWNTFAPYRGSLVVHGARNLVYGENGSVASGTGIRRLVFK